MYAPVLSFYVRFEDLIYIGMLALLKPTPKRYSVYMYKVTPIITDTSLVKTIYKFAPKMILIKGKI